MKYIECTGFFADVRVRVGVCVCAPFLHRTWYEYAGGHRPVFDNEDLH